MLSLIGGAAIVGGWFLFGPKKKVAGVPLNKPAPSIPKPSPGAPQVVKPSAAVPPVVANQANDAHAQATAALAEAARIAAAQKAMADAQAAADRSGVFVPPVGIVEQENQGFESGANGTGGQTDGSPGPASHDDEALGSINPITGL